eukprot:scaffold17793_cov131-Isochrysis_galbana.AAC.6
MDVACDGRGQRGGAGALLDAGGVSLSFELPSPLILTIVSSYLPLRVRVVALALALARAPAPAPHSPRSVLHTLTATRSLHGFTRVHIHAGRPSLGFPCGLRARIIYTTTL